MSLPRKSRLLFPVLFLAGAVAFASAGALPGNLHVAKDANGMPLAIFYPPIPTPVWLHASAATDDGALRTELMHPSTARRLEELLARPEVGGCIPLGRVPVQRVLSYPRSENLDDTLRQAPFVLHARVTGLAGGLEASTPGTLLRLSPLLIARGKAAGQGPFYTFLPVGRVQIGSKIICKTDAEFSQLPELGDEVFVFSALPGGEHGNYILLETPGDLITVHQGKLLYPKMYTRTLEAEPGPRDTPADILKRVESYGRQQ